MQVTTQNEFITHAVIGGGEAIEFGISNSAEFFNILSSTLYKDQILAVVREVLCNAWDAHIEAGITHTPVQITLTDDQFIIRDFGTGIHHDDMGMIYGTYGNSTKKNDGTQTGGFGLGCKSPFAYTDHFEVTSSHDGVRTIYNLSKSSAAAMGKPGIIPIATFPTTETGLQVAIRIHNSTDRRKFLTLIRRIARNGDMHMALNGEAIDRLGFDVSVSNYLITSQEDINDDATRIMIRYGNVVYPVDSVPEMRVEYQRIVDHLHKLRGIQNGYHILFQAPPHSIAVTPSRESLSMQEHTVKTLKSLFTGFIAMLDNPINGLTYHCEVIAESIVKLSVQEARVPDLLSCELKLPRPVAATGILNSICDLRTMADRYMTANYPADLDFRKKDVTWRLQGMVDAKLLDRGLVQTYLRALVATTHIDQYTDWLQRRIIAPLLVKMSKTGINPAKLYAYDINDRNVQPVYKRNGKPPLVQAQSIYPASIFHALPYLRNIVVLSTSMYEIKDRASKREEFRKMGTHNGFLFYHVGMKKIEREQALAFFQQSGMLVIDLNQKTAAELSKAVNNVLITKPRKATKTGVVALRSIQLTAREEINLSLAVKDGAERIAMPEFVTQESLRDGALRGCFDRWDAQESQAIVTLFGDKGGITFNSVVHAKWIAKGAKEMRDYLFDKVSAEMLSNPRIQEYWAFNVNRAINDANLSAFADNHLIHAVYATPMLRKEFGLINNLTVTDQQYVLLWQKLVQSNSTFHNVEAVKARSQLAAIPLNPANKVTLQCFKYNPLLDMINERRVKHALASSNIKPQEFNRIIQLVLTVLKK